MADTLGVLNPLTYRRYVYDHDTGLYYLQSRYYNPQWGRFLNADAYISTGQGLLGNNMFAYCLNNPVNSCDPCGTCFHNLKFYDCEKCAAFWNGVGQSCVDTYNRIDSVYQQQMQLETQIIMQQNEIIADTAGAIVDAYVSSVQVQQEMQIREAEMMREISPRVWNAGLEEGIKAAITTGTSYALTNNQQREPKEIVVGIGVAFVGGFVAGAVVELWHIIVE
jgi:RHS repeat-associated protein